MFSWLNFLTYAIITAITPGPNNIMSMSNAGRLGFRKAISFNVGILTGFSIVMLFCTFFCNTLSDFIPKIKLPMLIVGAAYMLWLAVKTLRSTGEIQEDSSRSGLYQGFYSNLLTLKFIYTVSSLWKHIYFRFIRESMNV